MSDGAAREPTFTYATTPGWWAPVVLDAVAWPALMRAASALWWVVNVAVVALVVVVLYVLTHPTLRYSPDSFSLSRGPFRTNVDLRNLSSVRVGGAVRRSNVLDPQTGERRSNVRWFYKSPDDWGGKPPIQGYVLSDTDGHRMFVNVARAGAPWAPLLLSALTEQPDVELGPRVVPSLRDFAR